MTSRNIHKGKKTALRSKVKDLKIARDVMKFAETDLKKKTHLLIHARTLSFSYAIDVCGIFLIPPRFFATFPDNDVRASRLISYISFI